MRNRILFVIGLALAAIVVVVSHSATGSFRGSLLSDQDIAIVLKEDADTNDDGILTAREIRTHLLRIIRGVILGSPVNDINGDGVVNQADTNATIRGFRALLLAVCGNGTTEAGEACDDGDSDNGDGCSDVCMIESEYTCSGSPSVCAISDLCNEQLPGVTDICYTFAAKIDYTDVQFPSSVKIGDLNGDGKEDVAVVNHSIDTVSVFFNNGDGTLAPKVDYRAGQKAFSMAIGDIDGDGTADLVVMNKGNSYGGTVSVFFNNGDGTFAPKVDYDAGIGPVSIAIGNLNADAKPDVALVNDRYGLSVLLNNGDGTFAPRVAYASGFSAPSIAIGDINGDDRGDLATINTSGDNKVSTGSVLLNNGDGTFAPRVTYTMGPHPQAIVIGDLNGDSKADMAVTDLYPPSVSIFFNNGDGTFAPKVDYRVRHSPYSIAFGDLNGDGNVDLATSNTNIVGSSVSVLLNNGEGTFTQRLDYRTGGLRSESIAIGNLNGDEKADLVTANFGSRSISVFLNIIGE